MTDSTAFNSSLATRIRNSLSAVILEPPGDDLDVLDSFARATWSGLGEPGDAMVGVVSRLLGPWHALSLIIDGASSDQIVASLRDSDSAFEFENDDLSREAIAEALERWKPRLSEKESLAHLARAQRVGAHLVLPTHTLWPQALSDLGDHGPVALWLRGSAQSLRGLDRSVSVVGARASTGYGEHVTMELVEGLCDRALTIVSGGAYGIDGMAHRAALAAEGTTVAILAGGVDRLYPSGHDALLRRIIDVGAVLTELPCGFAPTKWRFLQRNRLIAAVSQATVVVEAGWRSGSLNTAHHALELGRPVGVIPGPVTSASSAGCHRLLRETPAVCITTASEITELFEPAAISSDVTSSLVESVHPFAIRVMDALSSRVFRPTETLAVTSGLSLSETLAVLGLLSLHNAVSERNGAWRKSSS